MRVETSNIKLYSTGVKLCVHQQRKTALHRTSSFFLYLKQPNCITPISFTQFAKMVCLACLLPLFLIPVVNTLPLLFHILMARVYRLFGWEYAKPERVPAACPYKPGMPTKPNNSGVNGEDESSMKDLDSKPVELDSRKTD